MIRIGVDPGGSGALAAVRVDEVLAAIPMPVVGVKETRSLDFDVLDRFLESTTTLRLRPEPGEYESVYWVVERVHSMSGQGVVSSFSFGRIVGMIDAYVRMSRLPAVYVSPQAWKRSAGMIRLPKDRTVGRCLELVPSSGPWLSGQTKARAGGIADAILIARFGWNG